MLDNYEPITDCLDGNRENFNFKFFNFSIFRGDAILLHHLLRGDVNRDRACADVPSLHR